MLDRARSLISLAHQRFALVAMTLTSGVAPAVEPPPVPRISDVFNIPVGGMYPYDRYDFRFKVSRPAILESESMLAAGFSNSYRDNGVDYSDWKTASFWDLSGDGGPTSKTFTSRVSAGYGSVAYKSRLFLSNGSGSYRVVDRNPAVPDQSVGQGAGYHLGAISDKYIIFHTGDAYYYGTDIRFVDANTMNLVGVVRTNIRTARVAIGEKRDLPGFGEERHGEAPSYGHARLQRGVRGESQADRCRRRLQLDRAFQPALCGDDQQGG